ncbi:hypothetical protein TB2_031140 [Malus domestica]
MGFLIPIIDLNNLSESPADFTLNSAVALKVPKIELKLESFDEPLDTHLPQLFLKGSRVWLTAKSKFWT